MSKCAHDERIAYRSKKYTLLLRLTFVTIFFVSGFNKLAAQSLENVGKGKAIGVSGGINANNVFYHATGIEGRRNPYNYFLSGNLNISIYDWSIPLSFSWSDQQTSYQQPFNQYGLSPTYKWITIHAGYRSMMFSNYTVNGHLFLGGGFDVTPSEKVKVSGFYGRLQKAVQEDTTRQSNIPAYERMGGGVKVTIGNSENFADLIVFKAKDDPNSLYTDPVYSDIKPEENLVLGVNFGAKLMKRLTLKGEFASSAISKDVRSETVSTNNLYGKLGFGFTPRASSSYHQAVKTSVQYALKNMGVGFAYERIDPGYRTLGAYYFNNNLESFAFTNSAILFQKKVRLNAQIGVQRNNLDNDQTNTMNRLSGAINANYIVSPRLSYNLSYSNFQTVINFRSQFDYLNQVSPYENLDTLNYRQISQNANGNVNYVLNESKERRQNLSVNLTWQKTADKQGDKDQPSGATFYNFNTSYTILLSEHNLTLSFAGNANYTESQIAQNKIFGPTASARKTFLNRKVSVNATLSYNNSYVNDELTSRIMNIRLAGGYTLKEKHQFDLNVTQINRMSVNNAIQKRFSEFTVQFGYSYNFSVE